MKKFIQVLVLVLFLFPFVSFADTTVNLDSRGCTVGYKFSATTGKSCTAPIECASGDLFSIVTGKSCTAPSNLPEGCTATAGYSSTTGLACSGTTIGTTNSISLSNLYSATSITTNSATLNGNLISGAPANVYFIYSNFPSIGSNESTTPVYQFNNGTFSAQISNLTPNTTYQFYALANNASGKTSSTTSLFTTLPQPPVACPTGETRNSKGYCCLDASTPRDNTRCAYSA